MDGVVAYLLSRKFTKDTVIGMGAIKGAPCQVQSINKVGKTTTITLKWEDNLGVDHTQDFEIEDGIDVSSATITSNGHLELTLSDGNTLDCGKVLPQYDTMPTPSSTYNGAIYQYIGSTTSSYTNGYYYKCVNDGGTYKWEQINVQPMPVESVNGKTGAITLDASDVSAQEIIQYSTMPTASVDYANKVYQYIGTTSVDYTNGYFYRCELNSETSTYEWVVANQFALAEDVYTKNEIGDLSDLPDNTKDVVENIIAINNAIDNKQDILQYSTLPTASSDNVGKIVEFIGTTTADYTNGYFYQCKFDGTNYRWVQKDVQPSGGGTGSDNVVEGYFNPNDDLFYEEIAYINPIAGEHNVLYVSIDTNLLYRFNNSVFVRVDEVEAQTIQYTTLPIASVSEAGHIYQYIGDTTSSYTNGYFYKCVEDSGVYSWERVNTQDSYTKTEIGNLTNLPDNTKDVVGNISDLNTNKENVFRYEHSADIPTASVDNVGTIIQYVGTTTADYINGYFYKSVLNTDTSTYEWQNIDVQPASGISAVDSVNGKTGTVVLDAKDIGLQATTMPTADLDHLNQIVQFIGSTTSTYTNGYWYKCVYDSDNDAYLWTQVNVQPHISVDNALSDTSENPVQNKVIYDALDDKVDKVTGKGLSENDYTDADKAIVDNVATDLAGKADKVASATNNDFATLDTNGNLTDSGISKDIVPSGAASNNKLVTANDISTLTDKANKVTSATNGDIATLDSNGDLTDSGFSKDIIPSTATTSNKLATNADLPDELNDLDDVVITTPQSSQILAYNGTSGKWENKTGQETIGGLVFKGSILFANLPTTGMANGDAYDIKDAFTTDNRFEEGSGIACGAGTDVVWVASENKWNILTPSGVYSFNGRTGAVSPATSDYDADQIDYNNTTSGLTATDVQAAIDEVIADKADKVSSATNGHLAGLDGNGNLTDSGVVASNVIEKVATATGLLKDDGTVDTTSYAPSNKAYLTDDTAETTIDDGDYFPFYDTSATAKRKSLWSNIKAKLKTYFDTLYATIATVNGKADLTDLATEFDDTTAYTTGQYVIYNGDVYRFRADHSAGAWIGTDATKVDIGNELTTSNKALSDVLNVYGSKNLLDFSGTISVTANTNKTYDLGSVDLTQGDVIVFRCWQNNSMTSNVRNTLGIVDTIAGTQYWHSTSADRHLSAGSHVYIFTVQNTGKHNFRLWTNTLDTDTTYSDFMVCTKAVHDFNEKVVPYAKTNLQITNDLLDKVSYDFNAKTGVHQLMPLTLAKIKVLNQTSAYSWNNNVCTINNIDITFTVDDNGYVTNIQATGTPSADSYIAIFSGALKADSYKWSGCPVGGASNTYATFCRTSDTTAAEFGYDTGDGKSFTITQNKTINYYIKLSTSSSAIDLTFKPLLKYAEDSSNDYTDYALTNAELTKRTYSMYPTPDALLTESDVVDSINSRYNTPTNNEVVSVYDISRYSNEKKVRRVLNGANIPSGVSATTTGIGTWTDKDVDQIVSTDEADWWYDDAFKAPVVYARTTDTVIVTGKTYYTESGGEYTPVANPVVGSLSTYYEQYSDDVEVSIKFDPSGDTIVLGGYLYDTTTGKICIRFANSINITTARIAVDITYTRNEVG